ncbi:Chaperone DnaJ-domain containing protein [Vigna angularis]|uniref:Chaperone DnaJ-domain containing protein n=1 Tax=Phaseolus angularis TaxID=3914 RepID=A0A8T0KV65_PHAAN|nr:Chaperone DnaJ-domain containing protein [Vigna angularis]
MSCIGLEITIEIQRPSSRLPAKQNPIRILYSFLEDFSIMSSNFVWGSGIGGGWGIGSYVDVLKTEPGLLSLFCKLVAAAAYVGRYGIVAWQAFKARPPRMRRFYEGGFQATMTRREAALILGVRERTPTDKIKEAHRRVMVANHPDAGGSHYLASKINEAKDMLLGKTRGGGSAF